MLTLAEGRVMIKFAKYPLRNRFGREKGNHLPDPVT